MKKLLYIIIILFCSIDSNSYAFSSISEKKNKTLIIYFSVPETDGTDASSGASRIVKDNRIYGTTEYIANIISEKTGAEKFRLETVNKYPDKDHKSLIEYAKKEAEAKTFPALKGKIKNFESYDTIFIGYPNWWYDMPMVIYSLLNEYDFSGKTIIPFCTHGGSGFSQSIQTIKKIQKNANVIELPAISNRKAESSESMISKWLKENHFIN